MRGTKWSCCFDMFHNLMFTHRDIGLISTKQQIALIVGRDAIERMGFPIPRSNNKPEITSFYRILYVFTFASQCTGNDGSPTAPIFATTSLLLHANLALLNFGLMRTISYRTLRIHVEHYIA